MGIDAAREDGRDGDVTYDEFLAIVGRDPRARIAPVHKRRVRYTINGCMAERSEIEVDGHTSVTVAVESTDKPAVVEAVRSLGYGDFLNINYQVGLASLLADEPARYAVIDLGTNSIKFHVGSFDADGRPQPVVDRAEVTRLGEGLAAGGAISAGAARAGDRRDLRHGRRGQAAWRPGDRRGRHRGSPPGRRTATPSSPRSATGPASPSKRCRAPRRGAWPISR